MHCNAGDPALWPVWIYILSYALHAVQFLRHTACGEHHLALHHVTCGNNLDPTCTSLQNLQFVHRASLENQATCADYMIVETITSFVQFCVPLSCDEMLYPRLDKAYEIEQMHSQATHT